MKPQTTAINAHFQFVIQAKHQGLSFTEFLRVRFPFARPSNAHGTPAYRNLQVDQHTHQDNPLLVAGQTIRFELLAYQEDEVDLNWSVIWQNEALLVVNKPALLPVQQTTRNIYFTLSQSIRRRLSLPEAEALHRLDLETAGLIIFAKTKAAAQTWQPLFHQLLAKKQYRAWVWGEANWQQKTVQAQLVKKSDSKIRCQVYVDANNASTGKPSHTVFTCLNKKAGFSELACQLITGRKHQIRAHLAHLNLPIVGDKIYAHDGEFYLKRLADKLSPQDEHHLRSPHHLLVCDKVQLNLGDKILDIALTPEQFPNAWHQFVANLKPDV